MSLEVTARGIYGGLWALPRPLTSHWGQGRELIERLERIFGHVEVAFGKQDQIAGFTVDRDESVAPSVVADWSAMPFRDEAFGHGYWDPPYLGRVGERGDVHYNRLDGCLREIGRVLSWRLSILAPLIYPCPQGWTRRAVIGVTYGPNKVIRALQVFDRSQQASLPLPMPANAPALEGA